MGDSDLYEFCRATIVSLPQTGGRRAAILFSLVASCKANHVEPFAYLRHLFTRLPAVTTRDQLEALLPDRWL